MVTQFLIKKKLFGNTVRPAYECLREVPLQIGPNSTFIEELVKFVQLLCRLVLQIPLNCFHSAHFQTQANEVFSQPLLTEQ